MTDEVEIYKQAYERERLARLAAEEVVETRTRELFLKNQELETSLQELREHQRVMIQTEKLATLGTLISGVAHEINNPMSFVYANVENLQHHAQNYSELFVRLQHALLSDDETRLVEATEIKALIAKLDLEFFNDELPMIVSDTREGVKRVLEIIQSLRSFARMDRSLRTDADINECVNSTLRLLQNLFKTSVIVDLKLSDIPHVWCNPSEINQVLLNLLVNAAHALEGRDKAKVEISTQRVAGNVIITVADNGCGIPGDVLDHIFEPFYTTKELGKGTGMGLSIVYGIVQDHKGQLDVESTVDIGTTFRITLPIKAADN